MGPTHMSCRELLSYAQWYLNAPSPLRMQQAAQKDAPSSMIAFCEKLARSAFCC